MSLSTAYYDTVFSSLYDMYEEIRVSLSAWSKSSVTLRVCHGAVNYIVVLLNHFEELLEVFMVVGAILLIGFICRGEYSVECVHTYASLEAGSCLLSTKPQHFYFFLQVFSVLMKVRESVDSFACKAGLGCHQVSILRIVCQIVSNCDAVYRRSDNRMIYPIFYLFAEHVDSRLHFSQAFNILCSCH